jgi:hypothetical protein
MSRCHCGCRATHSCACDSGPFCREHYFKHVDRSHAGRQIVLIPYARARVDEELRAVTGVAVRLE